MADGDIKIVGLASPQASGKTNWKVLGAIIGVIVLAVGVIAGIILVRQQQVVEEQAAGNCDRASTTVQCPRPEDGALVSCNPPDANNNAQISLCLSKGRVEVCGGRNYCCPSAGGAWTTNMTACATPSPTATTIATLASQATTSPTSTAVATSTTKATSTATTTATLKPTKTPTVKPTATTLADSEATAAPIPETGASWPTIVGAGFGLIMIIASMALAL